MNDLSLFNSNQSKEAVANFVTIRQFAAVYGVSYDTVNNAVKRLFPEIVKNGKTTYLNEMQVAAISRELKSNNTVKDRLTFEVSSKVANTTTELELQQNFYAASQAYAKFLEAERARLQAENESQKQQLVEQAPKVEMYNKLVDRSFCKCLRDTAQFIGEHEKHFLQVLQDKKIIYKHAGHYRAYADYADCFELKAVSYGENKITQQLVVNMHGLELIKKIFKEYEVF